MSGKQFNKEIAEVANKALKNIKIEDSISQQPKSQIEQERFSYFYKDQITNVYNKEYLEFILSGKHVSKEEYSCVNIIYMHHFTLYNKKHSWEKGDIMLRKIAQKLEEFNKNSLVFRINGDDFILLNKEHNDISAFMEKFKEILQDTEITVSYKHFDVKNLGMSNIKRVMKLA